MRSVPSVRMIPALAVVAAFAGLGVSTVEARRPPVRPEPRPALKKLQALAPGIDLVETSNSAMHVHGGTPASIDSMAMNVRVSDGKSHVIALGDVAMLRSSCNTPKGTWDSRDKMPVIRHELFTWDDVDPESTGKDKVATPAKSDLYQVKVVLQPKAAYQACDRFAFAFAATVDGKRVELELPLDVMREEPLRTP